MIVRLPANTASDITDDAGNGRLFFLKNAGLGSIEVQDYLGVSLYILDSGLSTIVCGNANNMWDFYFNARNLPFDNSTNGFAANNTQEAIEEVKAAITTGSGFNCRHVTVDQTVTIPVGWENVTSGRFMLVEGKLIVDGMNTVLF